MRQNTNKTTKVTCAFLSALGTVFSLAALISPAWEVVHLREFQTEHEHGLWLDCARTVKVILSFNGEERVVNYGERHCTYKFDYNSNEQANVGIVLDENTPDAENFNHRRYKAHQVAYLLLIGISVISGVGASLTATGIHFAATRAFALFSLMLLISGLLSLIVVVTYFFISHSSEHRFVKGVIGTYETNNGQAFYFELISTICFVLALVAATIASKCSNHGYGAHHALYINQPIHHEDSISYPIRNKTDLKGAARNIVTAELVCGLETIV